MTLDADAGIELISIPASALAYNCDLKYRKGELHGNADGLLRLPLGNCVPDEGSSAEARRVNLVHLSALLVTIRDLSKETKKDLLLSKVLRYTMQGWPSEVESKSLPFFKKRLKISVEDGCLLWGVRAIIPASFQDKLLAELHVSRMGVVKMKSLARQYMWWPKIDIAIEQLSRSCQAYREVTT